MPEIKPGLEGFHADSQPAKSTNPDSDPLDNDELAALSGGSESEAAALIPPGVDEAVVIAQPQSL